MAAPTNVLSGAPATLVPGGADVPADLAALVTQVPTPTVALVASVSHKAITGNVATLTTVAIHGFSVGDSVVVAGVDATFNGTYTITTVPSLISFTYAKTNANVVRATATGSASKTVTSPIWVDGDYVDLDDSSTAYWDGDSWAEGAALPDYSYDHNDGWQHQPGGYGLTVATDVRY